MLWFRGFHTFVYVATCKMFLLKEIASSMRIAAIVQLERFPLSTIRIGDYFAKTEDSYLSMFDSMMNN